MAGNGSQVHIYMGKNDDKSTGKKKSSSSATSKKPTGAPAQQAPVQPQPQPKPKLPTPKAKMPTGKPVASGMVKSSKPTGKPISNAKGPSVSGKPVAQQGKGTQAGPTQGPLLGTMQSQNFPGLAGERQQQPQPPVPKKPPKESKPPDDVAYARAQQDAVLKNRQQRETRGKLQGSPRDVDAGYGSWPPLSPML